MSIPRVSVVIPTYNRANTVGRAVDSVLSQTDDDLEVIVIDDGSKDDTARVLERIAERDSRVSFYLTKNGGVSRARNRGAAMARGAYIAFLDSDDEFDREHIASRMSVFERDSELDALWGGVRLVGPMERQYVKDVERPGEMIHLSQCHLAGGLVVRRELFARSGGFRTNLSYAEDYELIKRLERDARVERCEDETYVYYVGAADQLSLAA